MSARADCVQLCYYLRGGTNIHIMSNITLISILIMAVWYDINTGCIPNKLNLVGCIGGLGLSIFHHGITGARNSFSGMVIPVILLFIFFLLHIVGAGDIKLLSAVGAFMFTDIFKVILLSFLITAGWGVISVISRLLRKRKINLTTFPMSVSIALATLVVMLGGGEWNGISGWTYR
ncbi:MAG: prepilin peptidase [Wujia sp.]